MTELVITIQGQILKLGVPHPFEVGAGSGDIDGAANVGGEEEVFRDKVGSVLNFRTLKGTGGISTSVAGDTVEIDGSTLNNTVIQATDPTNTDDSYSVGTTWINTANSTSWVIIDNTVGSAVWEQTGGDQWTEDAFTSAGGQITFILSKAPSDLDSLEFDVNGVNYKGGGSDYSISGVTITWLNVSFVMGAGDRVLVRYR